jgi:hypothetical protein
MMGKYINDREQHMGLPQTEYEPWRSSGGGGVNFPEIVPNLPPGTKSSTSNRAVGIDGIDRVDGGANIGTNDGGEHAGANYGINWEQLYGDNPGRPDFNFTDELDELTGRLQASDPSKWEQIKAEYAPEILGALGGIFGPPGAGTAGNLAGGLYQDYYHQNNQWASPAPPPPPSEIQQYLDAGNPNTWGAQQSPLISAGRPGPWRMGSTATRLGGVYQPIKKK